MRDFFQSGGLPGNHNRSRAVDGTDFRVLFKSGQPGRDGIGRKRDGEHFSRRRNFLHAPATFENHTGRRRQIERAGEVRRGRFPHAVSDYRTGFNPVFPPPFRKSHLQRKYRRLRNRGPVHPGVGLAAGQFFNQRPVAPLAEEHVAFFNFRPKPRVAGEQLATHRPPLGALAGQHKNNFPRIRGDSRREARAGFAGEKRPELFDHLRFCVRGDRDPVRMVDTPVRKRVANVFERNFADGEPVGILRNKRLQAIRIARRKHEEIRSCTAGRIRPAPLHGLQNHVGIRAAESERIHSRHGIRAGKLFPGDRHTKFPILEIDVGIRLFEVQVWRHLAMVENERGLDDPGNARSRFEMANVGFHRADDAGAVATVFGKDGTNRGGFNRIADRGSRAMSLEVVDFVRRDLRRRASLPDQPLLGVQPRNGEAAGFSILIHRAAADRRVNPVSVGHRSRQRFQDDDPGSLAADEPVSAGIECLAASVRGEHRHFAEADIRIGHQNGIHPACERGFAFAISQTPAGQMHRHQR